MIRFRTIAGGAAVSLTIAAAAPAQTLPAGPAEFAGGAVTVSGNVSVSISSHDDIAFFNYTDYEHNALRMFRAAVSGAWRIGPRLAVLTEIRSEDGEHVVPYAFYVRARPFAHVPFDIQAGRIPPVFGSFARRSYRVDDNPLIGYPLAYQYLTSLRPDAIPGNADDLLLMRGRGWRASYPVGSEYAAPGVPIVSAYRWDTGVEGNFASDRYDVAASVTTGTLSNPRTSDDNDGPQVAARVGWRPLFGLVLGASAAHGEFVNGEIENQYHPLLGDESYAQTAFGLDGEYSRDHWMVRAEWIHSRWTIPQLGTPLVAQPLTATSAYVEGRYRVTPRWYVAGRADTLTFSRVTGEHLFDGQPTEWDAPVERLEFGAGVYLQRNLTLRVIVQPNWRDGGRVRQRTYPSAELAYWF
ncbi:MAG TPA: hypothetical protein VL484_08005 [Vicinamibacterales bacterium]|jgi:hypothetical protein|nr:hypothetical protein [Vicinamibacterales bacterium]